jgi:DNA repair protein RadA/Sms
VTRAESRYVCQACGASVLRWEGQCRTCGEWNTLVETVVHVADRPRSARVAGGGRRSAGEGPPGVVPLASVPTDAAPRLPTGLAELDRVLGGGLVPGSLVLLGGEPGVGKSTLLLQAAAGVAAKGTTTGPLTVLYASGEESAAQVRLRADRLGLAAGVAGSAVGILPSAEIGAVEEAARRLRPDLLIVDSIQTMTVDELDGPAGSVGQVRESAARLMGLAKGEGIACILVGHVTKDGVLAGPKTLEHIVDAVLELGGERGGVLRVLRAAKNRFGSTEEIGVFELGEGGMREVADPARAFLVEHPSPAPGSVVAATMEGSRPLLVEVQALTTPAGYGTPARRAAGIDPTRLALLIAVLGRRAGVALGTHDVYANLAGGLAVEEPGIDLPLCLALASSMRDRAVHHGTVAMGEVGLLGELRSVAGLERRLREAARLGFRRAIVPVGPVRGGPVGSGGDAGIEILPARTLREAIDLAIGGGADDPAVSRAPGRARKASTTGVG